MAEETEHTFFAWPDLAPATPEDLVRLSAGLGDGLKRGFSAISEVITAAAEGTPGWTAPSQPEHPLPLERGMVAGDIPTDGEAFKMLVQENPSMALIGAVKDRYEIADRYGIGFFDSFAPDPDFNPFTREYLAGFEGFEERFLSARNEVEGELLKRRIREEQERGRALEVYNPGLVQQLAAGMVAPEVLIPLSASAGLAGLRAITTSAAQAGFYAGGIEAFRQGVDPSTELWQSIANVGAVTMFTGAFGAAGLGLRKVFSRVKADAAAYDRGHAADDAGRHELKDRVSRETGPEGPSVAENIAKRDAAVEKLEGEIETEGRWQVHRSGMGAVKNWSQMPWWRLNLNRLGGQLGDYASWLSHAFAGTPGLGTRGTFAGDTVLPVSVETAWRTRYRALHGQVKRAIDGAYWTLYRGKQPTGDIATRALETRDWLGRVGRRVRGAPEEVVSRKEFALWLTRYRALGEAPKEMPQTIREAIDVAAKAEDEMYDLFAREAEDLGLFGRQALARRTAVTEARFMRLQQHAEKWAAILREAEEAGQVNRANKLAIILEDILRRRDKAKGDYDQLMKLREPGEGVNVGDALAPHELAFVGDDIVSPNSELLLRFREGANRNILPRRPGGTARYVPIVWDRGAIRRNRQAFIDRLTEHFQRTPRGRMDEAAARAEEATKSVLRERTTKPPKMTARQFAEETADLLDQYSDMVNTPSELLRLQAVGDDTAVRAWATRERVLDVRPEDFQEFLVLDADHIRNLYIAQMSPAIEMARAFGDVDAGDAFMRLEELLDDALAKAETEADEIALKGEFAKIRQSALDLRDSVLGTYFLRFNPGSMSARSLNLLTSAAVVAQMGRSWQVAMIDAGKMVFTHGFTKTLGSLWRGLIDKAEREVRQINRADMEMAGQALETALLQTRVEASFGYGGLMSYMGRTEERLHRARSWMHFLNGMTVMTDTLKRWTGLMAQTRLLEAAEAVVKGGATREQLGYLGQAHISPAMAKRIWTQFEAHGSTTGQSRVGNMTAWTDGEAAAIYSGALSDIADATILTPGSADRPLFMSRPLWRTVLLYKGFSIAATQRLLAAGIQQRDMRIAQGFGTMMALGYLVDMLRAPAYDDRSVLSAERLERGFVLSGLGGIFTDLNDMLEMASGNELGLGPLVGLDPMFKDPNWAQRWGAIAGAAIQPWMYLTWAFSDPAAEADDKAKAVRRVWPFNNVWFATDWVGRMQEDLSGVFESLE